MFTVVDMWCLLFYLVPLLDLQSSALCPNRVWLKLNSFFCKIPFFFARPRTFNAVNTLMITSLTININTIIVGFWWVLMVCFLMLIVITTWYQQYLLSWILLYYSCLVSTMPLLFSADVVKEYQKHPSRGVLRKRYFENMQQIYRRTPMPKCDFTKVALNLIEIALRHGCSSVNLLHISRAPFPKSTSGRLLLEYHHSFSLLLHPFHLLLIFFRFDFCCSSLLITEVFSLFSAVYSRIN